LCLKCIQWKSKAVSGLQTCCGCYWVYLLQLKLLKTLANSFRLENNAKKIGPFDKVWVEIFDCLYLLFEFIMKSYFLGKCCLTANNRCLLCCLNLKKAEMSLKKLLSEVEWKWKIVIIKWYSDKPFKKLSSYQQRYKMQMWNLFLNNSLRKGMLFFLY
jgi:hypothetical protein